MKRLAYAAGSLVCSAALLYNAGFADALSRKELGIPEAKQEYFMGEMRVPGFVINVFDTNGDGRPDMKEKHPMRMVIPSLKA